jgi:hypothetical protein
MDMDISKRKEVDDTGPWWAMMTDGTVYISDAPCGHNINLGNHTINEDGTVQPSVICHNEHSGKMNGICDICKKPICGWHEIVRLLGWTRGKMNPKDVGHTWKTV